MPELNGGHLFIRCLKQEGIKKIFTIVGDTILPLVDAAADEGIEFIDTRHEGAAMHMADAYARTLSGGMRRRLLVAKALVHAPPVVVLDEPTAGVDIELRQQLWAYVRSLNARSTTILLTTHYLEEAEELCEHIAIIDHGRVIACEAKDTLLARLDHKEMTITVDRPIAEVPEGLERFEPELLGRRRIRVRYRRGGEATAEILRAYSIPRRVRTRGPAAELRAAECRNPDGVSQASPPQEVDAGEASRRHPPHPRAAAGR